MAILKNIDVAKRFNISPATVKNWIDYAKQDKFQLDLSRIGDRYFIKDTPQNIDRLSKLKTKGVKYRSKTGYIDVSPSADFYKIFNQREVLDLMNNLRYHHYIPSNYFYYDEGARWKYESLLDLTEINPSYNLAVKNISRNIKDFVRSVVDKIDREDFTVNIYEMYTGFNSVFCEDVVKYLISNGIKYNFISVSKSKETHDLRSKYLKNIFDTEIKQITLDCRRINQQDLIENIKNDNCFNFFIFPCGTINSDFYGFSELANLRSILRPRKDYILMDLDLLNKKDNRKKHGIASNLITLQKRYIWLLAKLGLQSHSDNNIFEISSDEGYIYKYLSLNRKIKYNYLIGEEKFSFLLEKDTSINYVILKKYTLNELVDMSKFLQYEFVNYAYTSEDSSALIAFTPKKISVENH